MKLGARVKIDNIIWTVCLVTSDGRIGLVSKLGSYIVLAESELRGREDDI